MTRSVLRNLLTALLIGLPGCRLKPAPTNPAAEPHAFVDMARGSPCADTRNRLFLIDQRLVFWDRAGKCADNSYGETLYGRSPEDILCVLHDSIAGPRKNCRDPQYAALFETLIAHLEDPDLGLAPPHSVRRLPL
ncbi:MAG TPA: hypothetical protein VGR38_12560 [Candidatus Polarisedimenticolia bacterium]|nr:hypothetical protein [Candidatus Polarisedimenticolia bacterium]